MRSMMLFVLLMGGPFGQMAQSQPAITRDGLSVEVRLGSSRVKLTDNLAVTVIFRSPGKITTIWNALGWGIPTGLRLQVLDASGHEIRSDYSLSYHIVPPDLTGKDALISIGGDSFAGFDSRIPVKMVFHESGRYTVKCIYAPTLPRSYFQGHTIWGQEDGAIVSAGVPITVDGH